jgi:fructokinase
VILVIGEVLLDIFPKSERLGGAPFNFAYHLKQFGFPVRFISRIGIDDNGRKILDRIKEAGFDPGDIQLDDVHPTGTVQVQLDNNGVPKFDIIPNVAYDYIEFKPEAYGEHLQSAELVYFGTLVQRTDQGFKQIQRLLHRKQSDAMSFYDINLRHDCYSDEVVEASLHETDILKLNADELRECKRITGNDQDDPTFILHIMTEYSLDTVALTKGDDGSELYTTEGSSRAVPEPVESMVDTVGAGDAYAAMLAAGILKKWSPQKTLAMAATFASRICSIEGAIPESEEFYELILKQMKSRE